MRFRRRTTCPRRFRARHSPPIKSPISPSAPPKSRFTSSRSPRYAWWIRSASRENGSVCSQTRPGPVSDAKNRPFAAEEARLDAADARDVVVDRRFERHQTAGVDAQPLPRPRLQRTMVPPLWMNRSPVPSIFWRMKPSPPKKPAPSRLVNATLRSMSPSRRGTRRAGRASAVRRAACG